jgi:hypothetical protein
VSVRAIYDYSIESSAPPPVLISTSGESLWDSAVWDTSLWDYSVEGKSFVGGSLGLGRTFAIAIAGNATTRINIVGWDCIFKAGGFL